MTRIAVLDPTVLIGDHLRTALEQRATWASEIRMFGTEPLEEMPLTEFAGEPVLVRPLAAGDLSGTDLILACGGGSPVLAELLPAAPGATTICCGEAGTLEARPVVAGVNDESAQRGEILLSPPAGVVALAHLLAALRPLEPRRAVATLLQPVSDLGEPGIHALMEQTQALLRFSDPEPGGLLEGQRAFNLLAASGDDDPAGQLDAILGGDPAIAVAALHAGTFHGTGLHLWFDFAEEPGAARVVDALAASVYLEAAGDTGGLGPVAAAGRPEVLHGPPRRASASGSGYWLWAVVDNLGRGGALNALEIAESLFGNDL